MKTAPLTSPTTSTGNRLHGFLQVTLLVGMLLGLFRQPLLAADSTPTETIPEFSFAIIADVQYADKETVGPRRYREALPKLESCLENLNSHPLSFIANLGDTIDGRDDHSWMDLRRILKTFANARAPLRHVIGNHCLSVPRSALLPALGLTSAYYSFQVQNWRFIVLDSMEVSLKADPGTAERRQADEVLAELPELPTYNGALGPTQLAWLQMELDDATQQRNKVVLLCHHPIASLPGHTSLLLWNAEEVLRLLHQYGCVVAFLSGHDHAGAYTLAQGIHHLTLPGMVEAPPDTNRYAIVDVYPNRLEVRGFGDVPSHTLTW